MTKNKLIRKAINYGVDRVKKKIAKYKKEIGDKFLVKKLT